MPGDPWLALVENLHKLAHRELALGAQGQQSQPARIRRRPQLNHQTIHNRKIGMKPNYLKQLFY
jgi:hypothetical protein